MQIRKILATPRSFAKEDDAPLRLLENAGFTVVRNVSGRILSKAEMIRQLSECEGVIVGVDPMDAEVIGSAKKLRATPSIWMQPNAGESLFRSRPGRTQMRWQTSLSR